VPLPANAQPIALHIPKDGRLVQWAPTTKTTPIAPTEILEF
jgi:hypothetical protein